MAGGVQRQTDVGSGAPETLWHACRGWLSPILQGPALRLTAVFWSSCKERKGVGGPDLLTGHSQGHPLLHEALTNSVPGPHHHAPTPPNTGPADSQPRQAPCNLSLEFQTWNLSLWTLLCPLGGWRPVQWPRDQQTLQYRKSTQAPQPPQPGWGPTCSSQRPVHLQPHLGRPAELLGSKLNSSEEGFVVQDQAREHHYLVGDRVGEAGSAPQTPALSPGQQRGKGVARWGFKRPPQVLLGIKSG